MLPPTLRRLFSLQADSKLTEFLLVNNGQCMVASEGKAPDSA